MRTTFHVLTLTNNVTNSYATGNYHLLKRLYTVYIYTYCKLADCVKKSFNPYIYNTFLCEAKRGPIKEKFNKFGWRCNVIKRASQIYFHISTQDLLDRARSLEYPKDPDPSIS